MSDSKITPERYQDALEKARANAMDAKYRKMAQDYAQAHRNDAQKEQEAETEREQMRRIMGLPSKPVADPREMIYNGRKSESYFLHKFMGISDD